MRGEEAVPPFRKEVGGAVGGETAPPSG